MKNFLFHIYNNYETLKTEITLFGFKIKIQNKTLVKRPDYTKVLNKLKEKYRNKEKIRVAFYVSENAKWNADELYNLLDKNESFEPIIIVSILSYVHEGKDIVRNNLQENFDFFKSRKKNVIKAYDENKKEYIPLDKFNIDIIFYQQPWGIPNEHNIEQTKDFALSYHFHYGLDIFKSKIKDMTLYRKLYTYFLALDEEKNFLESKGYNNTTVIGFPKLDIYKTLKQDKTNNKKTIIYAPHFSYKKKSILRIGTFDKFSKKMLDFAKEHSEYNWIFKPHPNLKKELTYDKNYGSDFANKYYSEWAKIGKVYEQGDYFNIFINSDLLITDCSSFLLEYLPTNKPLFRFERKDSIPLTKFGEKLRKNIYRINDFKSFERIFNKVIVNEKDILKEKRKTFINSILKEETSSEKIIKNIIHTLSS